jgi:GT2 family glycosyltransferase
VQRERFSPTRRSLASLLAHTGREVPLVIVDAGSPAGLRRALARAARARGATLLRVGHYLSPIEARIRALGEVRTPYVVFADNDVIFTPGWLDALVRCAEATGAGVVTPVICSGEPVHERVHLAGGRSEIVEVDGERQLLEVQRFEGRPLAEVRGELRREPTGLAEFHCVLVRAAALERIGGLDPGFLSTSEHLDFCLELARAGESIWLEPDSIVTYLSPPPIAWRDLSFYLLRWSDGWNRISEERLHQKWKLAPRDRMLRFGRSHRNLALARLRRRARALLGRRRAKRIMTRLESALIARAERRRGEG